MWALLSWALNRLTVTVVSTEFNTSHWQRSTVLTETIGLFQQRQVSSTSYLHFVDTNQLWHRPQSSAGFQTAAPSAARHPAQPISQISWWPITLATQPDTAGQWTKPAINNCSSLSSSSCHHLHMTQTQCQPIYILISGPFYHACEFHHPPLLTEASALNQWQTKAADLEEAKYPRNNSNKILTIYSEIARELQAASSTAQRQQSKPSL